MKTIKIPEVYAKNEKNEGDNLTHIEWNAISSAVNVAQETINDLIDDVAAGTGGSGSNSELSVEQDAVDADKKYIKINDVLVGELTAKGTKGTNVALSGDNNINIEPRPALGDGEGKNTAGIANRKGGNISLKPGDDIELCSHKRGTKKNTEVAVKVIDGSDNPVKLQVFAGDITLTTKGKNKTKKKDATTGEDTTELLYDDPNVMNVNITTGDGKGYLKVRAQAIDLRCEDHGGIALQPKGNDGEGHMNKIKFEHGGGDGLEFGTFNTEKTSIFTDEYRFNKNGVWKMATRVKETSDKYDGTDETTHYKYQKQSDDFYDVINNNDSTATTASIIGAGNMFDLYNEELSVLAQNEQKIISTATSLNNNNISTTFNYSPQGGLSIDTNKGVVTKLSDESQDNWPTTSNLSAIGITGTLNQDFNIVFAKVQDITSFYNNGIFDYNQANSWLLGSHPINNLENLYSSNDDSYIESENNALRSTKPTLLFLSTDDSTFTFPGNNDITNASQYIEDMLGNSTAIYKIQKLGSTKGIQICGNHVILRGGITLDTSAGICDGADIVTLINYMKTNNQGPWAN